MDPAIESHDDRSNSGYSFLVIPRLDRGIHINNFSRFPLEFILYPIRDGNDRAGVLPEFLEPP